MHSAATFLFAFLWCAAAAAQQAPVEDGLGPYRFGMSAEAARATSPNAAWQIENVDDHQTLTGGRPAAIGEARFSALLVFQQDQLERIVLLGAAPQPCGEVVPVVVEDLEQLYGPFRSAPALSERGALASVHRTPLGSEIRFREDDDAQEASVFATQRRQNMMIIVSGEQGAESGALCRVTIALDRRISDVPPNERDLFERVERAETVIVEWDELPDDFARLYPQRALEMGRQGIALLDCIIMTNGRPECRVAYEAPLNEGFGQAALRIAQEFRADVRGENAARIGKRVRMPIRFNISRRG